MLALVRRGLPHKWKFHGAFVLNRRVDIHAIDVENDDEPLQAGAHVPTKSRNS